MYYTVDENRIKAIADAIRMKAGTSGTMTVADMPQMIANIGGNDELNGCNMNNVIIVLPYEIKQEQKVTFKFKKNGTSNSSYIRNTKSSNSQYVVHMTLYGNRFYIGKGGSGELNYSPSDNDIHTLVYDGINRKCLFDDTELFEYNYTEGVGLYWQIGFQGMGANNTFYEFIIEENGKKICHIVPIKNKKYGIVSLYDKVNDIQYNGNMSEVV